MSCLAYVGIELTQLQILFIDGTVGKKGLAVSVCGVDRMVETTWSRVQLCKSDPETEVCDSFLVALLVLSFWW